MKASLPLRILTLTLSFTLLAGCASSPSPAPSSAGTPGVSTAPSPSESAQDRETPSLSASLPSPTPTPGESESLPPQGGTPAPSQGPQEPQPSPSDPAENQPAPSQGEAAPSQTPQGSSAAPSQPPLDPPAPSAAPSPEPSPTPAESTGAVTAQDVFTALSGVIGGSEMVDSTPVLDAFYNLDPDDLEDYCLYQPGMSAYIEEIFIAKVKSGCMETVKAACQSRQAGMEEDVKTYPATGAYLDGWQLVTQGDWILFCVCENPTQAVEAFYSSAN